jgi:hypothetical protein
MSMNRFTWRTSLRFLIATLVLVCLGASRSTAAIKVDDLLRALKDVEREVQSLSVTSRIEVLHRYFPGNADKEVKLSVTEKVIVDVNGRCRVETQGQSFKDAAVPVVYPEISLAVFDGHLGKMMYGSERYTQGIVAPDRSRISLRMDPRNVVSHYFGKPISQTLTEGSARIAGEVDWDGHKVLLFETKPNRNAHDERKYRFLVDPSLNFAVVKRAIAIRFPPYDGWIEYTRISCHDYQEAHPGVWLPTRVIHESFDPTAEHVKKNVDPPLSWRWNISMTDWKVNPDLPESLLDLAFSPDVYVNDMVVGHSYKVKKISDILIREQAEEAAAWQRSGNPGVGTRTLLIGANALILATFLSFMLWRRIRTGKPDERRPQI